MTILRKLGRPTDHRKAMLRNLVTSLLRPNDQISGRAAIGLRSTKGLSSGTR